MGHIKVATVKVRFPEDHGGSPMNFENMEWNKLVLLVGQNGSGKSFMLRKSFVFGFVGLTYHSALMQGTPVDLKEVIQFTVSHTFSDPDFSGTFMAEFDNGVVIEYEMADGIVTDCRLTGLTKETKPFPGIKFLSAEMRTFDDISWYLAMRKKITGGMEKALKEEHMKELCEVFKLYDVIQIEGMINACPIVYPDLIDFKAYDFGEKSPLGIDIDFEKGDFFTFRQKEDVLHSPGPSDSDEYVIKYCKTYSKGQQSLLNMFAANSY